MPLNPTHIQTLDPGNPSSSDLDDLAELLCLAVSAGAAVSFLSPLTHADARAWWTSALASLHPRGLVLVSRESSSADSSRPGRIVGTAQLQPAWAPNQPHRAEVCKVLVHPDVQRQGIARRLMLAIEDAARAQRFTLLTLDAKAGGPADRLYRSLGWTYIGCIPSFALDPDRAAWHDDALFYKHIAPTSDPSSAPTPTPTPTPTPAPAPPHLHHVAIICSDYARSKDFYTRVLGLAVIRETYRAQRHSYKLDLALAGGTQIELFSFPDPPARVSRPEACGLRHLALSTRNLDTELARLVSLGVTPEPIRIDEHTGKRYTFFPDPDGLPIELYESP